MASTWWSGLGLAIAKENAALLGATISASNRSGGGMRFVVEFRHQKDGKAVPM